MPAKRKNTIPPQLLSWHSHLAFMRDKHPNVPYKELLQMASENYKGGAKKKTVKRRAGMASPNVIAGRVARKPASKPARKPSRRAGMEDPHEIAGAKRRKTVKRGRGLLGDIAHGVAAASDLFGLGKKPARKPAAKRSRK